jgi:hypothetical protein
LGERSSPHPGHRLDDRFLRHDLLHAREQHFEHRPLARRELERLVAQEAPARDRIELQRPVRDARPAVRLRAAQQGAHARRSARAWRTVSPCNRSRRGSSRAQRSSTASRAVSTSTGIGAAAVRAQAAQHLEAVHLRQADVHG